MGILCMVYVCHPAQDTGQSNDRNNMKDLHSTPIGEHSYMYARYKENYRPMINVNVKVLVKP